MPAPPAKGSDRKYEEGTVFTDSVLLQKKECDNAEASDIASMWRACSKVGFPLCLDEALSIMFGETGKESVKSFAKKAQPGDQTTSVGTPSEIWRHYWDHVETWEHKLGVDAGAVIEYQVQKYIESKMKVCTACPVYKSILQKRTQRSD